MVGLSTMGESESLSNGVSSPPDTTIAGELGPLARTVIGWRGKVELRLRTMGTRGDDGASSVSLRLPRFCSLEVDAALGKTLSSSVFGSASPSKEARKLLALDRLLRTEGVAFPSASRGGLYMASVSGSFGFMYFSPGVVG